VKKINVIQNLQKAINYKEEHMLDLLLMKMLQIIYRYQDMIFTKHLA